MEVRVLSWAHFDKLSVNTSTHQVQHAGVGEVIWRSWCNGNTTACGAVIEGSTPSDRPEIMRYVGLIIVAAVVLVIVSYVFRDEGGGAPTIREGIDAIDRADTLMEDIQKRNNEQVAQ